MKRQVIYRWNSATFIALLLTSALVGCAGQVPAPTLPPAASPATEASAPSPAPEATSAPTEPGVDTESGPAPLAPSIVSSFVGLDRQSAANNGVVFFPPGSSAQIVGSEN